jgi:2-oxoisovalerate dehydrogenase E2 component (dihydrolipoyl transacylase)
MERLMRTLKQVTLPDLGEGLTESDLVEWTVAVGDVVELNQVVAEVETAKALVQLPTPYAGVVAELLVEAGATVVVGGVLLTIAVDTPDGEEAAPDGPADVGKPETKESNEVPERTSVLVGYGPLVEASARPRRRSRSAAWLASHEIEVGAADPALATHPVGPKVLPPVRKLAHDLGVDLNRMAGSGKDGLITREDVLHEVSSAPASTAPTAVVASTHTPVRVHESREVRIPVAGVRKQTAAAMVASAFTAPHASASLTVDVTPTMDLLTDLRVDLPGHRISILTLVAKAVTIAAGRNPSLNARWDEAAGEIVQHGYVHLGIAAATPRGLMVPTIKDADGLRLPELADAIGALTDAARAGTTAPADLAGGTITITNIGVFGIDTGTPILVPGQAAILAMGAIRRRPWELEDQIALRQVMTLSVSFDHRLVDGAEAAHFLTDIGRILARPGAVLGMV